MREFKFFQQHTTIIPNWYENYVIQKVYESRSNGVIPRDNIYHFDHYGESKCIIIRSVTFDGIFPLRAYMTINYELYHINPRGPNTFEDHSFTLDEEEYLRIAERCEGYLHYNEGWDEAGRNIELNAFRTRYSVWNICPYWNGSREYVEWERGYDDRWRVYEDSIRNERV